MSEQLEYVIIGGECYLHSDYMEAFRASLSTSIGNAVAEGASTRQMFRQVRALVTANKHGQVMREVGRSLRASKRSKSRVDVESEGGVIVAVLPA